MLFERKYFLDDLYMGGVVRPVAYQLSGATYWTNQKILDGSVNGAAWLARRLGRAVDWFDRKAVDGAVNGIGIGARGSGGFLKYFQSGNVQRYALWMFGGVTILAIAITVFR